MDTTKFIPIYLNKNDKTIDIDKIIEKTSELVKKQLIKHFKETNNDNKLIYRIQLVFC